MQKRWQVLKRRAVKAAQKRRHQLQAPQYAGVVQPFDASGPIARVAAGGASTVYGQFEKEELSDSSDEDDGEGGDDDADDEDADRSLSSDNRRMAARPVVGHLQPESAVAPVPLPHEQEQEQQQPQQQASLGAVQTGKRLFEEHSLLDESLLRAIPSLDTLSQMPRSRLNHASGAADGDLLTPTKRARQGGDATSPESFSRFVASMEGLSGMFPHSPLPITPGAGSRPPEEQQAQQQVQNTTTASASVPAAPLQRSSSLLTDVIGRVNKGRY